MSWYTLKTSWMVPIFKKGDRSCASNYRGITSLCAVSKAFELLLYGPMLSATSNYIMDNQHGFVPKRSTLTNLTEFVSFCKRNLDSGGQVDAIYTDLKAAFDLISHDILIAKLQKLGFSEQIVKWLHSYLTERSYKIKVNDHTSREYLGTSGVHQGSNLGPLLFILYINDVGQLLAEHRFLLFADDVKLFAPINDTNNCIWLPMPPINDTNEFNTPSTYLAYGAVIMQFCYVSKNVVFCLFTVLGLAHDSTTRSITYPLNAPIHSATLGSFSTHV